jgi:outer membrane protein TolC
MKRLVFFILLCSVSLTAQTVETITLDDCYTWSANNYPIAKQRGLIKQNNTLAINTLEKNLLPQIEFNAQGSYQSEVTTFALELPNVKGPTPLSKDQYKATLDVKQIIWDGGVIGLQKKVLNANEQVETQRIEVEIAKLKERVNALYFNVLQADANVDILKILKKDLASRKAKAEAAVLNGVALKRDVLTIEVEDLKANQRLTELQSARAAAVRILALLTGKNLAENAVFERPSLRGTKQEGNNIGLQIDRPELKLFDLQKSLIDRQLDINALKNYPRIMAFGTAGYGRPGLNFLKNEFRPYALAGVTFKWNLTDFYSKTLKNDLQVIRNNAQVIDIQRDVFLLNTKSVMEQESAEITKYQKLIETDRQIVALRGKIKESATAQVENGTLTTNDYLIELNAESQARLNLELHQLQLLLAQITLKTTTSN